MDSDFYLTTVVSCFAQLLRNSEFVANSNLNLITELISKSKNNSTEVKELLELIEKTEQLKSLQ